jgi:hypothetical protein
MGDLVNCRFDCLCLTQALFYYDFLIIGGTVAVCSALQILKSDWKWRHFPERFHKIIKFFHRAVQGTGDLRQRIAFRLRDIVYINRFETGNFMRDSFRYRFSVFIENRISAGILLSRTLLSSV